ncbi:ArdC-like ssDNA-binding domain-containing protein [Bacillus sp. FJAT-44742]|uniref:ArdC-like ssDNA-binding domain-containing protein n=1 Tax=Bacillus sp. FJAT-44742 TaxID=2014005 RepID=UPI0012FE8823|nr:ArdC-like ssDNA-binding domain-containing protein [Bacillus sp. FJAT-44742]
MKKTKEEVMKGIEKKLEKGIQEIFASEQMKEYLAFLSNFRQYSFNNTVLIFSQIPPATLVKGYHEWKKLGRYPKKGSKAIKILAPLITKKKDKETDEEKSVIYGFRYVNVFDVQQTEGEPLPEPLVKTLEGEKDVTKELYHNLETLNDIPIYHEDTKPANGYYHIIDKYIALDHDLSPNQEVKTLVHEYAHHLLHGQGATFEQEEHRIKEAQAEAVAYVVLHHYGIDTGEYSFGYIASWSKDPDIIKQIGTDIINTSQTILNQLEEMKDKRRESVGA